MDDMDVTLWSRLPQEIEEQMLAMLPAPTLGKFRVVCKRWHALISSPKFGARWLERAGQGACAVVARRYTVGRSHGWLFLDLDATRWYTLLMYHLWPDGINFRSSVTMDGGLVLQSLYTTAKDNDEAVSAIVKLEIGRCSCAHHDRMLVMPNGDVKLDGIRLSADIPVLLFYKFETDEWEVFTIPLTLLHSWNLMPDQPSVPILHGGPMLYFRKPFVGFRAWVKDPPKHGDSALFCDLFSSW